MNWRHMLSSVFVHLCVECCGMLVLHRPSCVMRLHGYGKEEEQLRFVAERTNVKCLFWAKQI